MLKNRCTRYWPIYPELMYEAYGLDGAKPLLVSGSRDLLVTRAQLDYEHDVDIWAVYPDGKQVLVASVLAPSGAVIYW